MHAYVTLKICEHDSIQAKREIKANEHLNAMITRHSGSLFVRTALDVFEIKGQESIHQCLVYKPLGMSLSRLRSHCPSRKFPEQLLKPALIHLLFALDFLHTEAKMVHTGQLYLFHSASFDDTSPTPTKIYNKTTFFSALRMTIFFLTLRKLSGLSPALEKSTDRTQYICHENFPSPRNTGAPF